MKNTFAVGAFASVLVFSLMTLILKHDSNKEVVINVPYAALNSKAKEQVECIAQNVYFEAGQESEEGQLAVAMVTMKRTKSSAFPSTPCGVVRQKTNNVCQFSWWCDKSLQQKAIKYNYSPVEKQRLNQIRKVAMQAYLNYGEIEDPSKGAMFYHAIYVDPKWKFKRIAKIGNHIFYRRS